MWGHLVHPEGKPWRRLGKTEERNRRPRHVLISFIFSGVSSCLGGTVALAVQQALPAQVRGVAGPGNLARAPGPLPLQVADQPPCLRFAGGLLEGFRCPRSLKQALGGSQAVAVPGYTGPAADRAQREPRPQRQGTPLQILGRVPGPFPETVAVRSPAVLPPFLRSTWPRRTPDGSEHRLNSPPHTPARALGTPGFPAPGPSAAQPHTWLGPAHPLWLGAGNLTLGVG